MKKYHYTVTVKVNEKGFVAQKGEEIVSTRTFSNHGYFTTPEVFKATLKRWCNDRYSYYTTTEDNALNEKALPKNFKYATLSMDVLWNGPYDHNFDYIIVE